MCFKLCLPVLVCITSIHCSIFFHLPEHEDYEDCIRLHPLKKKTIKQKVSHIISWEERTFDMTYYEVHQFFKPNGPIIINLESDHRTGTCIYGLVEDLVKELNGLLLVPEHRYYGDSIPVNASIPDNFKYLSEREAIADVINLVKEVKTHPKFQKSKVVAVGAELGGNLAVWMRMLYPNIVTAAVASSAPIVAKVDFFEFLENISENFRKYGSTRCCTAIQKKFQHYKELIGSPEGLQQLKREENICADVDMSVFFNQQHFIWLKLYKGFAFYATATTAAALHEFCQKLINTTITETSSDCLDSDFKRYISSVKNTNYALATRYRYCTQFGQFWTPSENQIFGDLLKVKYFFKVCEELFGSKYDENAIKGMIEATNKFYGGFDLKVGNVVFTHGSMDPLRSLGILENITDGAIFSPVIMIPDVTSRQDVMYFLEPPPKELVDARNQTKYYLKKWIS